MSEAVPKRPLLHRFSSIRNILRTKSSRIRKRKLEKGEDYEMFWNYVETIKVKSERDDLFHSITVMRPFFEFICKQTEDSNKKIVKRFLSLFDRIMDNNCPITNVDSDKLSSYEKIFGNKSLSELDNISLTEKSE
ncbi:hypothetical protein SNEBB_002362 [Seison nebaliae]|nr:hypothetical protein SNEBB_002362 [Seison nebaliae]